MRSIGAMVKNADSSATARHSSISRRRDGGAIEEDSVMVISGVEGKGKREKREAKKKPDVQTRCTRLPGRAVVRERIEVGEKG
ncbi:hypothetical protein GmRootV35_53150 [Variovorax sp. V35]